MSEIVCAQLHNELLGRRHNTLQSHGLFALAMHLYSVRLTQHNITWHNISVTDRSYNIRRTMTIRISVSGWFYKCRILYSTFDTEPRNLEVTLKGHSRSPTALCVWKWSSGTPELSPINMRPWYTRSIFCVEVSLRSATKTVSYFSSYKTWQLSGFWSEGNVSFLATSVHSMLFETLYVIAPVSTGVACRCVESRNSRRSEQSAAFDVVYLHLHHVMVVGRSSRLSSARCVVKTNRRAIAMMFVRLSVCLRRTCIVIIRCTLARI